MTTAHLLSPLLGLALGIGFLAAAAAGAGGADSDPIQGAKRDGSGRYLNTVGDIPTAGPGVTVPFFFRKMA
ncbi:MAG: hypothetical protein ACKOCT_05900, partial [Alphaproteobacteria bacterium]